MVSYQCLCASATATDFACLLTHILSKILIGSIIWHTFCNYSTLKNKYLINKLFIIWMSARLNTYKCAVSKLSWGCSVYILVKHLMCFLIISTDNFLEHQKPNPFLQKHKIFIFTNLSKFKLKTPIVPFLLYNLTKLKFLSLLRENHLKKITVEIAPTEHRC